MNERPVCLSVYQHNFMRVRCFIAYSIYTNRRLTRSIIKSVFFPSLSALLVLTLTCFVLGCTLWWPFIRRNKMNELATLSIELYIDRALYRVFD